MDTNSIVTSLCTKTITRLHISPSCWTVAPCRHEVKIIYTDGSIVKRELDADMIHMMLVNHFKDKIHTLDPHCLEHFGVNLPIPT